ncbi:thioesterase family protein [Gymnodinialimonas sp.]
MARILVYGDSNTHGTVPLTVLGQSERFAPGVPWPDVLAELTGHCVIAEGLPGRTTVHEDPVDGGARNGAAVLPAVLMSHVPLDAVVIMLGTNDLKPRFATSAFDIAKSVERLVGITGSLVPAAKVLVVCPAPVTETGVLVDAFAGAEARQRGLEAHMAAAATRVGAGFASVADFAAASDVDGVHLDAAAHRALAEGLVAPLGALLGAPPKAGGGLPAPDPAAPEPPVTLARAVPPQWVDYNNHMNEAFYLTAFSDAADQMLGWAGMDAACVADGASVFTVETHIRHLGEVNIGDAMRVTTRVMEGGGKKLHLWHEMWVGDALCATGEQLLLHMDLNVRETAPPPARIAEWLGKAQAAHAPLPLPEGFQRYVAQR